MHWLRTPSITMLAPVLSGVGLALAVMFPAFGQDAPTTTTVIQPENVRMDVAQVMRVSPIYQTLRATRMEPRCTEAKDDGKGLTRIVGAVKGALSRENPQSGSNDCELVPVQREFRRPIAYDVDYVYRGMKYRSRLPYDPGNRLKVRVSVMPLVPPLDDR